MVASNSKSRLGGRNAQKGILYQNSIAASHLFELLIGADRVFRVTAETQYPVDDILVERRGSASSYYQVKCYEGVSEWTVNRLNTLGILNQFQAQQSSSGGSDRLILSSPVPIGGVHQCSEKVREWDSYQPLHCTFLSDQQKEIWAELAALLGSDVHVYHLLCAYHEDPWPSDPDKIQAICLGRYHNSPYASIEGLWFHLRDIVARESVRGRPLKRIDLLALLGDRLPVGEAAQLAHVDINMARQVANPAWYVPRDEEFDLLSATHDLLKRRPRNMVVMGDGGTGKSSFFAWMQRELAKHKSLDVVALTTEGDDSIELIETIERALRKLLLGIECPEVSRVDRVIWYIRHAQSASRFIVILVDHFEALFHSIFVNQSRDKMAQARYSIVSALERTRECTNVMWVLLARSEYFFLMFPNEDSLLALNMSWIQLQDFSDQQAECLLRKLARIADVEFSDDGERLFLRNSPRNPLKLILAFLNLCRELSTDRITGEAILRLQPWEDVFRQDFSSLDDDEVQVVYTVASLMASTARRTFTFEEIESNLLNQPASGLRDVLHRIQATKGLLQQPIPGRYGLYHENFASYVISRSGGRVRTAETVREHKDFMNILLHETKGSLHGLTSQVTRLDRLLDDDGPEAEIRLRRTIEDLVGTLSVFVSAFRSAELMTLSDESLAQDHVAHERVSLARLIKRVTRHYGRRLSSGGGDIRVSLPEEEMFVKGDDAMLSTALANIIDNAVKYSSQGKSVWVVCKSERSRFVIDISNIGVVGIRPEEEVRVFEPYYRGSGSAMAYHRHGAGLGLSIAKRVVHAIHGTIEVSSTSIGEGYHRVTVKITLPKV